MYFAVRFFVPIETSYNVYTIFIRFKSNKQYKYRVGKCELCRDCITRKTRPDKMHCETLRTNTGPLKVPRLLGIYETAGWLGGQNTTVLFFEVAVCFSFYFFFFCCLLSLCFISARDRIRRFAGPCEIFAYGSGRLKIIRRPESRRVTGIAREKKKKKKKPSFFLTFLVLRKCTAARCSWAAGARIKIFKSDFQFNGIGPKCTRRPRTHRDPPSNYSIPQITAGDPLAFRWPF